MNPYASAFLGAVFVAAGLGAVILMLRIYGRPVGTRGRKKTILAHRALGGLFLLIYVLMMVVMVAKVLRYPQLSPLQAVHMALGTLILPLLLVKVLIVRFFRRMNHLLPGLGVAVFSLGFVTVLMGVLPLAAARAQQPDTKDLGGEQLIEAGETLTQQRCQKCHDLDRVYDQKGKKTRELWAATLDRMVKLDPPLKEVRRPILAYLQARLAAEDTPRGMSLTGAALLEARCQKCHTLDRVYRYTKTKEDWLSTVRRYAELLPDHIHAGEIEPIAQFLFEKRGKEPTQEDLQRRVFEQHCGTCHNLSKATDYAKQSEISPKRWGRVIRRMERLYKERELPEDKLWSKEEKQTIAEYLASLYKQEPTGED